MKELEKTKRISVAAVLFILIVIIALFAYERPKHLYKINSEVALNKILTKDYFITLDEINSPEYILIDVRNKFEFDKGHIENAFNIHTPELLSNNNSKLFKKLKKENKIVVLYGSNPTQANAAYMILLQLGYDTIKILLVENSHLHNKLITKNCDIEKNVADINAFIKDSQKKAAIKPTPKKIVPKKVIKVKKKKKMPVEGGC